MYDCIAICTVFLFASLFTPAYISKKLFIRVTLYVLYNNSYTIGSVLHNDDPDLGFLGSYFMFYYFGW